MLAASKNIADCSASLSVTVTPCPTTVTANTVTVTSTTSTTPSYPMKREIDGRQNSCTPITSSNTGLPKWAADACTTSAAARFSSACSCNGVIAATTTLAPVTSTVTPSTTVTVTATARPSLYLLNASGDRSLYVTVDETNAVRLTRDISVAVPFYQDSKQQWRNWNDPSKLFLDYYLPNRPEAPDTANDVVYDTVPAGDNYGITCRYNGGGPGSFWGQCQAPSPGGNPVVYGFGTCPDQGYYLYMIPNNSNVRCWGGYAFIGFFLVAYTGA